MLNIHQIHLVSDFVYVFVQNINNLSLLFVALFQSEKSVVTF